MSDPELLDVRAVAIRLSANAELLDIRAVHFEAALHNGTLDGPFTVEMLLQPSAQVQPLVGDEPGSAILYSFVYQVKVLAEEASPVADFTCRYQVAYAVRLEDLTGEEIEAFGESTVSLALYPYIREYVQSASGRLNIGPVVLPLYRQPVTFTGTPQGSTPEPARSAQRPGKKPAAPTTKKSLSAAAKKSAEAKKASRSKG